MVAVMNVVDLSEKRWNSSLTTTTTTTTTTTKTTLMSMHLYTAHHAGKEIPSLESSLSLKFSRRLWNVWFFCVFAWISHPRLFLVWFSFPFSSHALLCSSMNRYFFCCSKVAHPPPHVPTFGCHKTFLVCKESENKKFLQSHFKREPPLHHWQRGSDLFQSHAMCWNAKYLRVVAHVVSVVVGAKSQKCEFVCSQWWLLVCLSQWLAHFACTTKIRSRMV